MGIVFTVPKFSNGQLSTVAMLSGRCRGGLIDWFMWMGATSPNGMCPS
jgi:hypothetical protein